MISMSDIIPAPVSIHPATGDDFVVSPSSVITVSGAAATQPAATWLAGMLRRGTGYALPIVPSAEASQSSITLALGDAGATLGEEGYRLTVSATEVRIHANTDAGLFHGAQTLRQLLPPEIESAHSHATVQWVVPGGEITDHPQAIDGAAPCSTSPAISSALPMSSATSTCWRCTSATCFTST